MKLVNFETRSDETKVSHQVSRNKEVKKQLKNHLDLMRQELTETNNKINELKNAKKNSEWEKIDFFPGKSIEELQEQGKKLSNEIL